MASEALNAHRGGIDCAGKWLDLSRPQVMGVLNVTPDSFSDGGRHNTFDAALDRAQQMVEAGAAIIDIGGESTRPGAQPVSLEEERRRVLPLIEALAPRLPVPISIDTAKGEIMRMAVEAGAGMINDVWALRAPESLEAAATTAVPVCLMHMQGEPRSMQDAPAYRDVVEEVRSFLADRVRVCEAAGIARRRLIVDPGFGFGKTLVHNVQLLRHLVRLGELGLPVLVGLSRKSMLGTLTGRPVDERLYGGLAAAVLAVREGARIVRTHDVRATVEALQICEAVIRAS